MGIVGSQLQVVKEAPFGFEDGDTVRPQTVKVKGVNLIVCQLVADMNSQLFRFYQVSLGSGAGL